jgi:2,4-dienoyl-CoA reductase-like NADH-dependent reductase (Old Yellow Enzyme family)
MIVNPANNLKVRDLSSDEVYEHVDDFVQAARRAVEAGFDAVQIHAAHGWFVSAFLSPVTNFRQDEWGGTPEKRWKFAPVSRRDTPRFQVRIYRYLIKLGLMRTIQMGKHW